MLGSTATVLARVISENTGLFFFTIITDWPTDLDLTTSHMEAPARVMLENAGL